MLRFLSAGESHGPVLTAIIDGLPCGINVDTKVIDLELARRQHGYGRGQRMGIERDRVRITSGVRAGKTTGAPVGLAIANRDREHPERPTTARADRITCPRPGHADFAGAMKYAHGDIRNVLERASARETALRVAAGAICKLMLRQFDVAVFSHTLAIGNIRSRLPRRAIGPAPETPLRCLDPVAEKNMMKVIDRAARRGDSLGGLTEIVATNVCPGLGTYVQFDRRIDATIALHMMSIPSVKGVEIGTAFANSSRLGHTVHDELYFTKTSAFIRKTNRAGGIEGGMTNGAPVVVRLAVKPVPSVNIPMRTVDLATRTQSMAHRPRADTCVVPAVGVIGEAMLAYTIAGAILEKFGGDNIDDVHAAYLRYQNRINHGRQ